MFKTTQAAEQANIRLAQDISEPTLMNLSQSNMTDGLLYHSYSARQRSAPDDLRVVCWPPGQTLPNVRGYLYDEQWREKPTVYIIDNGLDSTSTVSVSSHHCPSLPGLTSLGLSTWY